MKNKFGFQLSEYKNVKANYHTHTTRCKHATGEEHEYVEAAIKAGYKILGFSDHSPYPFGDSYVSRIRMRMDELEGYVDTICRLKQEYKNDIRILLGLEAEYFPEHFENLMAEVKQYPMDYMILGQHSFETEATGEYVGTPRVEEHYIERYVNLVLEGLHTGYFMYVAHPDIMNFVGNEEVYYRHMKRLAEEMKRLDMPVELNVNGYREKKQYPAEKFLQIALETGNEFIVGVDAHSPKELLDMKNIEGTANLVADRGGKLINNK